jgi:hypothetical protein
VTLISRGKDYSRLEDASLAALAASERQAFAEIYKRYLGKGPGQLTNGQQVPFTAYARLIDDRSYQQ